MDQPGMVTNPAARCGQLKSENLASRELFGRPVVRQPAYSPHSQLTARYDALPCVCTPCSYISFD